MVDGSSVRGYFELARPVNAVAAGILTLIGAFVATGSVADPSTATAVAAAVGATIAATAGGNAVNDVFDLEIDRINDPHRPLPRGAVSPRGATVFAAVLFAVAVGLALTLPVLAIAIAAVNLVALVAYTRAFKGRPGLGNAVVAYLGGSTFLFGGAAVGDVSGVIVLFLLAALSTFAREVVKDAEDVVGDEAEGLSTLPIRYGRRPALAVGAGALVLAIAASPLPYLDGTFGPAYLAIVVPADAVMLYAVYESFGDPHAAQTHLKYGMFVAMAAFVVGRLAG